MGVVVVVGIGVLVQGILYFWFVQCIVQLSDGGCGIMEGWMCGDVFYVFVVDINFVVILQVF